MIARAAVIALVAALACSVVTGAAPASPSPSGAAPASPSHPRASLPDIEQEVMCPVCGTPLAVAESPQAERERSYIRDLIARGETKAQIKRDLVGQFGPAVLALPAHHGFDLAAYLVPLAVVVALLAVVAVMLPRWRRRGRDGAIVSARPALGTADAARLDEDLARFEG